jgi:hypothetical protein
MMSDGTTEAAVSKRVVIEIPAGMDAFAKAIQEMVDDAVASMRSTVDGRAVDYAAVEEKVGEKARAVERGMHQALLSRLDVDAPRVMIGGKPHARVGRGPAPYYTKAGEVSVERSLYREIGAANGKTVDAVGVRAGVLGDGWLPGTAAAMAFLVSQTTSREAAEGAKKTGRLMYSRSAFEDLAHLVGEHYVPRHKDVEDALISAYVPPTAAASVSAALDRVSLPMEEPRPRPVGRPRKGAAKRPIARNFRMAWCGTVTLHDAGGRGLQTIRYGLMPHGDPVELVTSMAGDVAKLLEKRPDLGVAALADGAHDLWGLLEDWLNEDVLGVKVHYVVDLWHVLEKLGKAACVIHGKDSAPSVVQRWRMALLNRGSAAEEIVLELWRSGKRRVHTDEGRPVHEAIRYLLNHRKRMGYASARRRGLPVGSGTVEATCKTLVETRMKRAGSRWKETTGDHVLQLRALAQSDRWDQALALTLAPLRKAVQGAA